MYVLCVFKINLLLNHNYLLCFFTQLWVLSIFKIETTLPYLKETLSNSMDINTAGAGAGDVTPSGAFCQWTSSASLSFQHFLDKTTPYLLYRWIAFFFIAVLYVVRVYLVEGFYVISYALGIYLLNLLIGFLSPQVDPELQDLSDGPTLPTRETDEFRPFVRRLPEFKFWYVLCQFLCFVYFAAFVVLISKFYMADQRLTLELNFRALYLLFVLEMYTICSTERNEMVDYDLALLLK